MKTTRIVCDNCGLDLTFTSNEIDYRIALGCELIYQRPGAASVTAMYITPQLSRGYHFCSLRCLKSWVEHNI